MIDRISKRVSQTQYFLCKLLILVKAKLRLNEDRDLAQKLQEEEYAR